MSTRPAQHHRNQQDRQDQPDKKIIKTNKDSFMPHDTPATPAPVAHLHHPKFRAMLTRRIRVSLGLTLLVLLCYGFYILATAWLPELIARPVSPGRPLTWGLVIVLAVILNGMLCAGLYTWWANRRFDALKEEFLKEVGRKGARLKEGGQ